MFRRKFQRDQQVREIRRGRRRSDIVTIHDDGSTTTEVSEEVKEEKAEQKKRGVS